MSQTIFIFDFDGTIADTHRYIIDISNRLSDEFNFKKIKDEEIEGMKGKTAKEIIKILSVPIMKIPAILSRAKKEFYEGISSVQPIDGLQDCLSTLNSLGTSMGILSSNSAENIHQFLKHHDLNVFEFIETTSKVWSKNTCLKKILKKKGYTNDNVIYIGDETRDIDAAQRLGIRVAAVAWGYNNIDLLKKHQPDFIINTPDDLFALCKKLST